METIEIREKLILDDESIEIRYKGVPLREDSNENDIRHTIKNFIDNHRHDNMLENVTILRTILRDYKEESLDVYFCNRKCSEAVRYDKLGNVNSFGFIKEIKEGSSYKYKITYDSILGLQLNYHNEIYDCDYLEKCSFDLSNLMKSISNLSSAGPIVINDTDKELIEIYKLFYKENPNFMKKDVNIRVQTMMSILAGFGITLDCDYAFSLMGKEKMPLSLGLMQMVQKLYPLGEVMEICDNIKLKDESREIIGIVGDSIRELIHDDDMDDALITISKVIYASRYNLSSKADINEIAKFTNRGLDEVKTSVQLVKKIEKRLDK